MEDKVCLKCRKKESKSEMPFLSVYGFCNECHSNFIPYIVEAKKKFLKDKKKNG